MDKVAIRVSGDRSFFDEVVGEAARLDRSPSWLLGHCLGATLPRLHGSLAAAPRQVRASRKETRTFFVPRDLMLDCGRLAMRLGMSSDDVLAYAWTAAREDIRSLPTS